MKRPETHRTDEGANRIFRNALPLHWVARPQSNDYGLDYLVEIGEGDDLIGLSFAVQLKGTTQPRYRREAIIHRLRREHLEYYFDHRREAVFLVVVDVNKRQGYWLFLQDYVLERLDGRRWREQESITIDVPLVNRLDDTARLHAAVKAADLRMSELRPGSILGAVEAEQKRVVSKDPRFQVDVNVSGGKVHYQLTPKIDVEGTLKIVGSPDQVREKIENLIERGLPVSFAPSEVKIAGMPLLEDIEKDGGTIHWSRQTRATATLVGVDAAGRELAQILDIPGKFSGGTREQRFEGGFPKSPFRLRFSLVFGKGSRATSVHLSFDPKQWFGQRITELPYFSQLAPFFLYLPQVRKLRLICHVLGNEVARAEGRDPEVLSVEHISAFIQFLETARNVAGDFNIVPVLPYELAHEAVNEVLVLQTVMDTGEYRFHTTIKNAAIEVDADKAPDFLRSTESPEGTSFSARIESHVLPFWGQDVEIGPVEFIHHGVKIITTMDEIQRRTKASTNGRVQLEMTSLPKSQVVIRRLKGSTQTTQREG